MIAQATEVKEGLIFLFDGSDGHKYYRWPKDMALSNERYIMASSLMTDLAIGMSGEEFSKSIETARTLIAEGLKNPKVLSKLAAVVELMGSASHHLVHRDILINLAAVYIIRDDESPEVIHQDIHTEKLTYFEDHISNDPHAFFLQTSIEELKHLQSLSDEELNRQWMASPMRIRAVGKMLDRFMAESGLSSFDPTLKTS